MHLMMVRSLRTIVGRVAVGTGQTKTASSIAAIGVDTGMVVRRLLSFQGMRRPGHGMIDGRSTVVGEVAVVAVLPVQVGIAGRGRPSLARALVLRTAHGR